ncbi:MAG: DUF1569 domain-containing protein [Thermoanaerobaculia bacterium]
MRNLFEPGARQAILGRLADLSTDAARHWGKMDAAQMMAHCSVALEAGTGDKPLKQKLIGKIFAPFVKKSFLGEKPFPKNSPTDPTFIVTDARDFAQEKDNLTNLIGRFCAAGPAEAGKHTHSFLGRISGDGWGVVMYKHLDHHLRQFGA